MLFTPEKIRSFLKVELGINNSRSDSSKRNSAILTDTLVKKKRRKKIAVQNKKKSILNRPKNKSEVNRKLLFKSYKINGLN